MASASLQCLWLVVLATVLLQTLMVAVTFVYFSRALNTMQGSFSQSSMSCLMESNAAAARQSDSCWQVTQQLQQHVEKTMTGRFQEEISKAMRNKLTVALPLLRPGGVGGGSLPKVAAHVTTAVSSEERPMREGSLSGRGYLGQRIRAWEGHRGLSFLQNIELRGGELLVPTAGLYYVYGQTYFRLSPAAEADREPENMMEDPKETEGTQLVQYIYKKMSSYTVPILLMKSSQRACWPRGREPGLFSLHQAGTAFLQPADRLFITVSNASSVEMDGRASYFGAFLVG